MVSHFLHEAEWLQPCNQLFFHVFHIYVDHQVSNSSFGGAGQLSHGTRTTAHGFLGLKQRKKL